MSYERNDDGSISIVEDGKYWSARREHDGFDLRDKNLEWEHFTLDRAEFELTDEFIPPIVENFKPTGKTFVKLRAEQSTPKVSVIIPMYNAERFVAESLESLLKQSMNDFEVIIVDDRSTDRSVEIVERMIDRFKGRLRLVRLSKNSGNPGAPRNVGLSCAVGKYVFFMDSDDLLKSDALASLYKTAEKYHADALESVTNYYLRHYNDREYNIDQYSRRIERSTFEPHDVGKRLIDFTRGKFEVIPWNKFVRRQCLVENQVMFPPTYAVDDAGFSFQCALAAKVYALIPEPYYYYRILRGSISQRRYELTDQIRKHVRTVDTVFKVIEAFLARSEFIYRHPEFKYLALRHFFNYCVGTVRYVIAHYHENPVGVLYNLTYENISDGVSFNDELIAYFLTINAFQDDWLADRDRRIHQLQRKLDELRSKQTKNPAI